MRAPVNEQLESLALSDLVRNDRLRRGELAKEERPPELTTTHGVAVRPRSPKPGLLKGLQGFAKTPERPSFRGGSADR
jgi:hypothetical protein